MVTLAPPWMLMPTCWPPVTETLVSVVPLPAEPVLPMFVRLIPAPHIASVLNAVPKMSPQCDGVVGSDRFVPLLTKFILVRLTLLAPPPIPNAAPCCVAFWIEPPDPAEPVPRTVKVPVVLVSQMPLAGLLRLAS